MSEKTKGYLLAIVAAATYGMNPLFALPLYQSGMNPDSVLFFRYLFAIPLVAAMIKGRGRNFTLRREEGLPLLVLGILVAVSSLTLFQSYNYMDAGIASTILFVYPIMVALIMAAVYKERITGQTAFCILAALAGIGLLYQSDGETTLSLTGTMLVLGSALSYALYIVGVNRPALKECATLKVTFYVLLFGLSLFATRLLWQVELTLPGRWYLWGNLMALAVFPTAISFLCTTSAIQRIGSTPTAILGALEPLTAILFGITMFGERLNLQECLGIVLILVAVTVVVAGGSIAKPLLRLRKMFPRLPRKERA